MKTKKIAKGVTLVEGDATDFKERGMTSKIKRVGEVIYTLGKAHFETLLLVFCVCFLLIGWLLQDSARTQHYNYFASMCNNLCESKNMSVCGLETNTYPIVCSCVDDYSIDLGNMTSYAEIKKFYIYYPHMN